jgi:hypothetical protein
LENKGKRKRGKEVDEMERTPRNEERGEKQ